MNKKIFISAIFSAGVAIGAVASEVASSGLYTFKSGDPIVASEVNANFELLSNELAEMKATAFILNDSFDCEGDDGGRGYFGLWANNTVPENDIYIQNGTATQWSYSVMSNTFTLNTTPNIELSITAITNDQTYLLRIEPVDPMLEKYSCYRG